MRRFEPGTGPFIRGVVAVLLALALGACAVNPVTGRQEIMLVSEAQEIKLGQDAAPSLRWSFGGEFRDPELKAYLQEIVKRIWANSERPNLPLSFYVQNSSLPNAFALPGHVAITRGLLAELDSEAQFAYVMGHETGHVSARHSAKRLTQASLLRLGIFAGGAALGSGGGDLFMQAGSIGGTLLLLKFSRSQELQADRLGVRYMSELGYDPNEALKAHERLQAAADKYAERTGGKRGGGSKLGAILSTHPRQDVRMDEMRQMIDSLPPYGIVGDGVRADRFRKKTAGLREVHRAYFPYDRAERLYEDGRLDEAEAELKKALGMNDAQPPFHTLYGMIRIRQARYDDALTHIGDALRIEPGYQPALFAKGVALYKLERYWSALEQFHRSKALYPTHLGTIFGLGASYFELDRCGKALPYLGDVAGAVPKHPEVHGMLGICHERAGNLQAALKEYRLQLQAAPDNKYGRHARQRLRELTGQGTSSPLRMLFY